MIFQPKVGFSPNTQMVGFGPGSGTSIAGGTYFNVDADSFNAHGVDRVVTLAANQTGPGLFPASTLVFPNEFTNPNFDVVVSLFPDIHDIFPYQS